jgi:hypothetical protein
MTTTMTGQQVESLAPPPSIPVPMPPYAPAGPTYATASAVHQPPPPPSALQYTTVSHTSSTTTYHQPMQSNIMQYVQPAIHHQQAHQSTHQVPTFQPMQPPALLQYPPSMSFASQSSSMMPTAASQQPSQQSTPSDIPLPSSDSLSVGAPSTQNVTAQFAGPSRPPASLLSNQLPAFLPSMTSTAAQPCSRRTHE